jgi:hypothetical protein
MATHSYKSILKIGDGVEGGTSGWPSDTSDPSTGDPSSGFTMIDAVQDFDGPGLTAGDQEVTAHGQDEAVQQWIMGLKDYGEVSFDINWDPAHSTHDGSTGLLADYKNRVNYRDYVFVPASDPGDGSHCIFFQGYVKGFEPSNPVAGVQTVSVTIKVTGTIVLP